MSLQSLKKQYIKALYKEGALLIRQKPFPLHHGGESHIYLNHSIFLTTYKNLNLLAKIYLELLSKDLKEYKIGVVDSIMSPLISGLIATMVKKDIVITKEQKMAHGIESKIYGKVSGEIILIDDVTTSGSILINAAKALREKGAIVRYALVSACRDLSAIVNLQNVGIQTFYIATYEEVLHSLWNTIPEEEKSIVLQEIKEKQYNWNLTI